jgi:acyl carrier protein
MAAPREANVADPTPILSELQALMCRVFEHDDLPVTRTTSAVDVQGWDSIANITLLLEIESHFRVRFSTADVSRLRDVGGLVDLIAARR